MKNIKYTIGVILFMVMIIAGCKEETFEFGDLSAPTNMVINTDIIGESADSPTGDGSGEVLISVSADNAFIYHIGYNKLEDYGDVQLSLLPGGAVSKKFTDPGINTYRITVVAFGKGGVSSNLTKDIEVRSDFVPEPQIVTDLTNDSSKTWVVDKSVSRHFGVDDFTKTEYESGWWWEAGPDEKVDCCNCFYTATFTFANDAGNYSLTVDSPDGIFTKTGELAGGLPGIPDSGDEGCYDYAGGSSSFAFIPSGSGISAETSTKTAIQLAGVETFIGYGATLKEYEILEINPDFMYLRVQGTETGNSWYLKLKPAE